MKKSVTALICGLIGSIVCLGWGFFGGLLGSAIGVIAAASETVAFRILAWVAFFGAIVGIVGSALSTKKAMPGGAICLSVAAVACGAFHIYLFSLMSNIDFALIVVTFLPVALIVVAAVFDWLTKEQKGRQDLGAIPQPAQTVQPQTQGKTLEQELVELKQMVEKGLLTEEEFAEAKKSVLAKHNK